jgi:hypothetical protein
MMVRGTKRRDAFREVRSIVCWPRRWKMDAICVSRLPDRFSVLIVDLAS